MARKLLKYEQQTCRARFRFLANRIRKGPPVAGRPSDVVL